MSSSVDILVIETIVGWSTHLETAGEICLRYIDEGKKVGFAYLGENNPDDHDLNRDYSYWDKLTKRAPVHKVNQFSSLIESRGVKIIKPPSLEAELLDQIDIFCTTLPDDLERLKNLKYKQAEIGRGILSSLISKTGNPYPHVSEHTRLIETYLRESIRVFEQTLDLIERFDPDKIVTFNGRFALSKAIAEAAHFKNTEILFHERGADYTRYKLQQEPIHDISYARELVQQTWNEGDYDKCKIAHKFFERRRKGEGIGWYSFTDQQETGFKPPKSGKKRIVYFSSSDDEYAAVGDLVRHPLFPSQREAVLWLTNFVKNHENFELYIRVHPHLSQKAESEGDWWHNLGGERVIVIKADSTIDSYALADSADMVVAYVSTIGLEAAYWGRPSIILGDALYRGLECVYEPETIAEFEELLKDEELEPLPRENCLPNGYYNMVFGYEFKYYEPSSLSEGTFLGTKLTSEPPLIRFKNRLRIKKRLKELVNGSQFLIDS